MRTPWVSSLLLCSAFGFIAGIAQAQTQTCPVTLHVDGTAIDATNVSSKAIVLIGVEASTATQLPNIGGDDFYFKPLAAGESYQMAGPSPDQLPITKAEVVVVQFADGTIWGDSSLLQTQFADMMQGRLVARKFYQGAISAYDLGGDYDLVKFLTQAKNSPPTNRDPVDPFPNLRLLGGKYLRIQQTSGSRAAINEIQSHLDAAKGRSF